MVVLVFLHCSLDQPHAPISADHKQVRIDAHVLAVAASNIKHDVAIFKLLIEKLFDFGPWFVPGMREVRGNAIIHFINMFVFHDGGEGGVFVGDLDFEDLLGVLFGFLLWDVGLLGGWVGLFGFHGYGGGISFISIMSGGLKLVIIKNGARPLPGDCFN